MLREGSSISFLTLNSLLLSSSFFSNLFQRSFHSKWVAFHLFLTVIVVPVTVPLTEEESEDLNLVFSRLW